MTEAFNNCFTTIGPDLAREIPKTNAKPESYHHPTDKVFSLKAPNVTTVCKLLSKINKRNTMGLDKIPCKLLKLASGIVGRSLSSMFKRSVETGFFPNKWKAAKVTPIFKKGTKSDLNNYRPISVLPIVSKIFETIIFQQLYDYLNKYKLLNNYQSGFRLLHSTLKASLETMNNSSLNIDNGLLNGIIFINLSEKAFDTIDHEIILRKLANYRGDEHSLHWLTSYLSN